MIKAGVLTYSMYYYFKVVKFSSNGQDLLFSTFFMLNTRFCIKLIKNYLHEQKSQELQLL